MPDLEPITRDEMLWSGEDLEPITRREMYIKHLYDETQVIPDKPITREEMFILKAGEELHDVTIEQLNVTENGTYSEAGKAYSPVIVEVPETTLTTLDVTENGTYTAPSGTAYNEVDVEVPLPENAYLLKDIPATPTAIATFTDGAPLPLPKLEIAVEPQQAGSGEPSPTNIRPISGWTECKPTVAGKNLLNANTSYNVVANTTWIKTSCNLPIGTYTFSYKPSSEDGQVTFNVFNEQDERIYNIPSITNASHEATFTISERASRISSYSNSALTISEIQIEKGSTASDYVAYNPNSTTYTIDLNGTRYGGKLRIINGVAEFVATQAEVDLGTLNWNYTSSGGRSLFTSNDITDYKHTGSNDIPVNAICECFVIIPMSLGFANGQMGMDGDEAKNRTIICDNRYSSASDFKTAMNGVQLVYELATPTIIPLGAVPISSLQGTNNVWADTGNILSGQYFGKGE